jgi:4-hydroxybutyryl-CoA dehydratase/vinylacetyl-CoA-Delta-isomerase
MIRTVEQYLESLRDGRVIYCLGERVKDVTTHPVLRRAIQNGAMDYIVPNHPDMRDLFVTKNEDGEDTHFLWTVPKTAEDLLRRREIYIIGARFGGVSLHCMGVDGLAACRVLADRMDKALGTNYTERVENFRKYIQKTDIGLTTAQTDIKGDRGLHPSQQVQHKDFYVRVVDKQKEGIIVRGCKYHISSTPGSNEAFVIPSRTHSEEDKDYAVAFVTPLNAKGITLICADPEIKGPTTPETTWESPIASRGGVGDGECMIVFEDVFVPWERVFMCQEWQFSRDIAYLFATFHRLFACCRMVPMLENLTGIAALMAEYNGLERYTHIREKLSWMAQVTEAFKVMNLSACMFPEKEEGSDLVNPNRMYINIAKYMYADNFHEMVKLAQDIAGGIIADPISYRDWHNPETRPYIEKYAAGKAGVLTEDRLKAIRYMHDITGGRHLSHQIHAEGSLAAQRMMFYASAEWDYYKAVAKRSANISGWESDERLAKMKSYRHLLADHMPAIDTSYEIMKGQAVGAGPTGS